MATRRDGVNWQRAGRTNGSTRWTHASQILRVEGAKSRSDGRPDPDDPFFDAWPKLRDPKLGAKK